MSDLQNAFKLSLPLVAGYIMLGMAFGILFNQNGFNALWAAGAAVFIYGGTMQFIAVSLLSAHEGYFAIFVVSLVVGFRQIFYTIAYFKAFQSEFRFKKRMYMFFALADEVFALLSINKTLSPNAKFYFSLLSHSYWILGCGLGALIGGHVNFDFKGIEFVLSAVFVVIILEQVRQSKSALMSSIGILSAILALVIFGSSNFLLPAIFIIVFTLFVFKAMRIKGVA